MRRRDIIAATAAGTLVPGRLRASRPQRAKPEPGDVLVHAFGERKGVAIAPGDVVDERLFAFPRSPEGVVRDGSLHNQVSLVRVDPAAMSEKTRRYAAGELLALSAACTHTGCEVSGWNKETNELVCPCHGSTFAVLDAARPVIGPATKPLAYLPIAIEGDTVVVAGKFSRRVGPAPQF